MAQRFFLYARKSQESEEKQILSIEAQITELRSLAEKEKIEIAEEFIEAMTAKEPGRPIFNRMLKKIESGEAQGILAWHPDRLARNSVDGGRVIYLIDTGHIQSLKFPTFWFEDTPQGKFMLNIAFGQSKYFVDNLSVNVKRGIRQKLRNGGWPHPAPVGYSNDTKNKTVVVDPLQGPLIQKMFREYTTGTYTLHSMRDAASAWGVASHQAHKKLPTSIILRILTNPFYYGLMPYNGEMYQGKHEPLITRQLFVQVQEVLQSRGKNHEVRKHHFPFLQLASCTCGAAITGERQKGHHYYRCTRKKGPCDEPYLREELLDRQITDAIQNVALPEEGYNLMLASLNEEEKGSRQRLREEQAVLLAPLQKTQTHLDRLLDLHIQGVITQQEYVAKKEKLLNQKIALEEKLAKVREGGNLWLEPLREFLKEARHADQTATDKNLAAKRDTLKKIGSNFCVKSRTLEFHYHIPWSLLRHSPKSRPLMNWGG